MSDTYRDRTQTDGDLLASLPNTYRYTSQALEDNKWAPVYATGLKTKEDALLDAAADSIYCDMRVVRVSGYPVTVEIKGNGSFGEPKITKRLQFIPHEVVKYFKHRS